MLLPRHLRLRRWSFARPGSYPAAAHELPSTSADRSLPQGHERRAPRRPEDQRRTMLNDGFGMPTVELHTIGRKTGARRSTLLTARRCTTTTGSCSSRRRAATTAIPEWYLNLRADPDVELTIDGVTPSDDRPHRIREPERAELWPQIVGGVQGLRGLSAPDEPADPGRHLRTAVVTTRASNPTPRHSLGENGVSGRVERLAVDLQVDPLVVEARRARGCLRLAGWDPRSSTAGLRAPRRRPRPTSTTPDP